MARERSLEELFFDEWPSADPRAFQAAESIAEDIANDADGMPAGIRKLWRDTKRAVDFILRADGVKK